MLLYVLWAIHNVPFIVATVVSMTVVLRSWKHKWTILSKSWTFFYNLGYRFKSCNQSFVNTRSLD